MPMTHWVRNGLVAVWALSGPMACKEKTGIDALPASLRPAEGQEVQFYRVGALRCPYWLQPFEARDGRPGGNQCVNRATLGEICRAATCEAQAGDPPAAARGR
jgi:hypothetical protein